MNRPSGYRPRPRRLPVRIPVTHSTIDVFLDSEIMNLSTGGVFLKADITLPLGSEVDYQFTLPGSDKVVEAVGTVIWARKAGHTHGAPFPEHPPGMGVQFKEINVEDLETLLDEIERLLRVSE